MSNEANKLGLGQIITTEQNRDAIHVAIAPVVAAETLMPGTHVGIDSEGKASIHATKIGAVDPFMPCEVMAGQGFWLFLFPGTISSLRHEWTHPALQHAAPVVEEEEEEYDGCSGCY